MALSAFDDKANKPGAKELAAALGRTSSAWNKLKAYLAAEYAPLTEEWKYYGQKYGWTLQLKQKKRTILYMTPLERYFLVGIVLGEKTVRAARKSDLPDWVLGVINRATKHVEGRGIRLEIKRQSDLEVVGILAAIKMAH
ncbi:MAG TPA: DUF3788 domain-containing protein [Acidobacteriota bacterium]|nr:DUF3788 domain-containing protein [Acidobacteriota bacterium]